MPKEDLVKIIPKPKPKIPAYLNFLFWFFLILLIVLVGFYFFLENRISSFEQKREELEKEIAPSQNQRELEEKITSFSKKMSDFPKLLENHKITSNLFNFLKAICHPKVQFTSLRLDVGECQISLFGKTESFHTLGEQILILQKEKDIKGLEISNISFGQEGKVNFGLTFTFSKELIEK